LDVPLVHPSLVTKLRQYQQRAVQWALRRERQHSALINTNLNVVAPHLTARRTFSSNILSVESEEVKFTWKELRSLDGKTFYFNMFTGAMSEERVCRVPEVCGGILADEMGLGKTVEVLALILMNPYFPARTEDSPSRIASENSRPSDEEQANDVVKCYCGYETEDDNIGFVECEKCKTWQHCTCVSWEPRLNEHDRYLCPDCVVTEPLRVRATLIVCPDPILDQWCQEVTKHTLPQSLKVFVYRGIRHINFTLRPHATDVIVRAAQLGDYDIVLTTYSTLREELYHVETNEERLRRLRFGKKYRPLPTPLIGVEWHRLVLDEAQMVGEGTTKAAMMAACLKATYRWAVSGTPIQRGLDDLYGLVFFLDLQPYANKAFWRQCIHVPYQAGLEEAKERLYAFLRRVMWRSNKEDVESELGVPLQTESVNLLRFTAVEDYFYKKRHAECHAKIQQILARYKQHGADLTSIHSDAMKKLLRAIVRLRQACCHPQVGSKTGFQPLQKTTLTMSELLNQLIEKARLECEEAQRALLAALNGLAGIANINQRYDEALQLYRRVIGRKEVDADPLQLIHAYHNLAKTLAKLIQQHTANNASKKENEDLVFTNLQKEMTECTVKEQDLKQKYLERYNNTVVIETENFRTNVRNVEELKTKILQKSQVWWVTVLDYLETEPHLVCGRCA
jgi:E3 ubiquitin-protein ligase SHPRH